MRRFIVLAFIAIGLMIPAAASAGQSVSTGIEKLTVDKNVTVINENQVRVSGTITCDDGDRFRVAVNSFRTNKGATEGSRSSPDTGNCTGEAQNWRVIVDRESGPGFQKGTQGEVRAAAQSGTPGDSSANDREQVKERVVLN